MHPFPRCKAHVRNACPVGLRVYVDGAALPTYVLCFFLRTSIPHSVLWRIRHRSVRNLKLLGRSSPSWDVVAFVDGMRLVPQDSNLRSALLRLVRDIFPHRFRVCFRFSPLSF